METMTVDAVEEETRGQTANLREDVGRELGGLSSTVLKTIAIITMLIDHIGAAIMGRMLSARGLMELFAVTDSTVIDAWFATGDNRSVYLIYVIMRQIGRTAFPIYCFMLVEGMKYTRNAWKYAARLGVFALISEIPFDLAFKGELIEFQYQNVFFTLAVSLVSMIVLKAIQGKNWNAALKILLSLVVIAAGIGLAVLLKTDYDGRGVACILAMYLLRRKKWLKLVVGYVLFVLLLDELLALPAFVLLAFYQGKKGNGMKYFFYGFYPVHLLLLYLTAVLLGIAAYPAV